MSLENRYRTGWKYKQIEQANNQPHVVKEISIKSDDNGLRKNYHMLEK